MQSGSKLIEWKDERLPVNSRSPYRILLIPVKQRRKIPATAGIKNCQVCEPGLCQMAIKDIWFF